MTDPQIIILIRLSKGRKKVFERCVQSLRSQTFQDFNVAVSIDDPECAAWVPKDFQLFSLAKSSFSGDFFYNGYCNVLKSAYVPISSKHWFFFLDCDDYLATDDALERIAQHLKDPWQAVVCQMSRADGKLKPSDELMNSRHIISGRVGLPCLILRAQYKTTLEIGTEENSDFQWIKTLTDNLATKFVKQVLVHSPQRNYGKSLD
ncbi:glycosyltransferase family A protein [Flavobacterium sp.]|uniref:glycosyltransferase family A protein n=1 Tax=Flavobacterium sp. TaxID=239 RepID=UPI00121160ED|nr:glycosyltransferase family A protein [Flavobacterium sp.]RZJ71088.1 MAG: glycosyltransferase family 2 protein [Flavobacterium sp.]